MKRIKITVAYDGTNYSGWQIQPNGLTIEEVLNRALSGFLKEEIHIIGASRTDSGVHAMGNVAVFDTKTTIPPEKICLAVNPCLPEDIRIVASCQVANDFHPRHCDTRKTYEYHIQNGKIPFPTQRLYSHLVTMDLDISAMEEAGQYLVGTHDFKSFCAAKTQAQTTVRTVNAIHVEAVPGPGPTMKNVIIQVKGEGFLYNMVRIISGTLIKVGIGVYPPVHVKEILEAKDRSLAGETVPAKGLFLKEIEYL
ncbi:MAG: tRNA pseudouridine(38-40) synthase TruA [Eubacterium sp.]|nr:tRNA pseudouridine(38-40) synthase TruA [Eubacterium sp.]MDD7210011.1 tRNA pseudouridine(38-40) synthase TruA [Lachnospiraceae bacterium]MDY5497005.1 tRNA pseudouridine(38-40) synthase TruA [Anaerobutyricum sp.]